jgi:hypothetical protein
VLFVPFCGHIKLTSALFSEHPISIKKSRLEAAPTPLRNRGGEYTDWFEDEMID